MGFVSIPLDVWSLGVDIVWTCRGVLYLSIVRIPLGRHRPQSTSPRKAPVTKVQFHQSSPMGNRWVYWIYIQCMDEGLLAGVWVTPKHPHLKVFIQHRRWLSHSNTYGSTALINLHQPIFSASSWDPQAMCNCGRISGRWLGRPASLSGEGDGV